MNRSTVYNDCDNWAAHILTKAIDSGFCKGLMDYTRNLRDVGFCV